MLQSNLMRTGLKEIFLCIVLLVASLSVLGQRQPLTADQIVEKMSANYASVDTYQDEGSVYLVKDINVFRGVPWEEVLLVQDFERLKKVTFKSYFQRPGRVRFEWIDNESRVRRYSVVWSDGQDAYSWRTDYDDNDDIFIWDNESSLKWAVEQETRGSMSVFDILYSALTGSKEYFSFIRMTQARIAREELVVGSTCYLILGYIGHDPWALWIDKETFILRRYRMQISTGTFDEAVRTGYMPTTLGEVDLVDVQTNGRIAPSTFRFRPQLRKGDIDISKYKDERIVPPPPPLPKKPDPK